MIVMLMRNKDNIRGIFFFDLKGVRINKLLPGYFKCIMAEPVNIFHHFLCLLFKYIQFEQHTGKKAEDLSEEELEGAMDELDIQAQEPTDEEIAMLEAENEPDEKSATQAVPEGTTDESYLDELERLASLCDQGVITREEFDAKKKDLLGL